MRWVALLVVLGCTASEPAPAPPHDDEVVRLVEEIGFGQCAASSRCDCIDAEDGRACLDEVSVRWQDRLDDGHARGLTLDEDCLAQTRARIERQGCLEPSSNLGDLCAAFCAMYVGEQPLGAACTSDDPQVSDCEQGLLCHDGVCGRPCEVLGGLPEGAACATPSGQAFDDCASGLVCDAASGRCIARDAQSCAFNCAPGDFCHDTTQRCETAGIEGEYCDARTECADTMSCNFDTSQCEADGDVGDECGTVDNRRCRPGLTCIGNQCVGPPGVGESCLGSSCAPGAVCDRDVDLCVALPVGGQACIRTECASGHRCEQTGQNPQGLCVVATATGEACSGHLQCGSRFCPAGFCVARPRLGDACDELTPCEVGLVCDGVRCVETRSRAPAVCGYAAW